VHRVHIAVDRDGPLGGDEGLRQHLTAEYATVRHPLGETRVDVLIGAGTGVSEVERREKSSKRVAHAL